MKNLEIISNEAVSKLNKVKSKEEFESLRIRYFGRKRGVLTKLASELPSLSVEEKRKWGPKFNQLKQNLSTLFENKEKSLVLVEEENKVKKNAPGDSLLFDPTVSGTKLTVGHTHPLTQIIDEVKDIFHYLGFSWVDGPEVETDKYNFQKLLIHKDHPSRDVQQTYYINDELLLRTHTSPVQIRYMEKHKPPIRIISPGRVYRRDMPDATHLPDFLQIEGLLIDEKASLTDLLGVLDFFVKRLFGSKSRVRFYGHNFPYTEPSVEVEVYHKKRGWIEILG